MIFLQNNLWWWLCRKIRCTVLTGVRKQLLLGWILRTAWWNLIYTVAELLSMGHGKWGKKHLFKKQTSSYNYTISGYKIILWIWFTAGNDLGIKNNPFTKGVNSKHDLSKIVDVFSEVLGNCQSQCFSSNALITFAFDASRFVFWNGLQWNQLNYFFYLLQYAIEEIDL